MLLEEILSELEATPCGDIPAAGELGLATSDLVYVIYTSGSTGQPEGYGDAPSRAGQPDRVASHELRQPAGCRVLQFAALSFDVAFQEIFCDAVHGRHAGAAGRMGSSRRRRSGEVLERAQIDRPAVRAAADAAEPGRIVQGDRQTLRALRDVITAGEQLRISAEIAALFEQLSGSRLHNHYGPTETHVSLP